MKTLGLCQWHRSSVFIVNCEHISDFLLINDFEQANVCRVCENCCTRTAVLGHSHFFKNFLVTGVNIFS